MILLLCLVAVGIVAGVLLWWFEGSLPAPPEPHERYRRVRGLGDE